VKPLDHGVVSNLRSRCVARDPRSARLRQLSGLRQPKSRQICRRVPHLKASDQARRPRERVLSIGLSNLIGSCF
jgi:hypothetical protein